MGYDEVLTLPFESDVKDPRPHTTENVCYQLAPLQQPGQFLVFDPWPPWTHCATLRITCEQPD